ncbi:Y+L amino acid transporter 2-like [Glandiceps talaboti]
MIIQKPTSQAVIMLVCIEYIVYPIFPECGLSSVVAKRLLASAGIILITLLNCVSARWSARLTNVLSYSKLLATGVIIVTGLYYLFTGHTENFNDPFANSTPSVGNIALAMYSGLWAFSGWTTLNYVTEEMANIPRNLPRAIMISVSLVMVVYLLTNISYFAILSPTELLNSNAVAVTFADSTLGVMAWIMPLFVGLSTFGATNASVFSAGRLYFSGAREGQLPDVMAMIHINKRTPVSALLFNVVLSIIMVQISDINTLINYVSFVDWLSTGIAVVGMLWLRYKQPELHRPIKLPLFVPIIFILMTIFLVVIPFYTEPVSSGIGLLIMFAGLPLHFLGVLYKRTRPKTMKKVLDSMTWFSQMFFQISETDWDNHKDSNQ